MPATTLWTDAFLEGKRQIGDPLADDTLEALIEEKGPEEAKAFFNKLIRQIELPVSEFPDSTRPFFEQTNQLPDWADWNQVDIANAFFIDHGPKLLVFLYYKSLPQLYSVAKGAEVLVRTGRLSHKGDEMSIFARRIAETGQFLLSVMAPDHLHSSANGIQAIQKVRLIHASIRKFVGTNDWDQETLGVPINQEDLAITLMTFSVSLTDAMQQFGLDVPQEQKEAYFQVWRAIGHNMGIEADLIPDTLADGRVLLNKILQRQSRHSEAGVLLTNALLAFANETMKGRFEKIPPLMIRHLVGQEMASNLGLGSQSGCLGFIIPEFVAGILRLQERLEDRINGPFSMFIDEISELTMRALVSVFDKYKQQKFSIPASLARHWDSSNGI